MRRATSAKLPEQSHLYTIGEAAEFLGKPVNTVKEWVKLGKFPAPVAVAPNGWRLWNLTQLRKVADDKILGKTT